LESMREVEAKSAQKNIQKAKEEAANGLDYKERKRLEKDLRSVVRKLEEVEQEIENLEEEINTWDEQLADPQECKALMANPDFYPKYEEKKSVVTGKMEIWEQLNEEKEALESQLSESYLA